MTEDGARDLSQIFDLTDTTNWPPHYYRPLAVIQGTAPQQRGGKAVWGLRLQVKVSASWPEYTKMVGSGIKLLPRYKARKLMVFVYRAKRGGESHDGSATGGKGGKDWPPANSLFKQNVMTEMPLSAKTPKGEVIAWDILEADEKYYRSILVPQLITVGVAEPAGATLTDMNTLIGSYEQWDAHTTETWFDIDLRGSKIEYNVGGVNTTNMDLQVAAVWVTDGDIEIKPTDGLRFDSVFTWQQAPPKRLWSTRNYVDVTRERNPRRGRDDEEMGREYTKKWGVAPAGEDFFNDDDGVNYAIIGEAPTEGYFGGAEPPRKI